MDGSVCLTGSTNGYARRMTPRINGPDALGPMPASSQPTARASPTCGRSTDSTRCSSRPPGN